ncbi:cobaltochelatase CobT-related protein [Persephonella sp.]
MNDKVFKLTVQNIMKDNQYDRIVRKRKKGKIDDKSTWKVSVNQEKIFKQKSERQNKRYNVLLLVDCSGSMWKDRTVVASESAIKLMQAFENAGVNIEIVGFNLFIHKIKAFEENKVKPKFISDMIYKLSHSMDTIINWKESIAYHETHENYENFKGKENWKKNFSSGWNCDGEAIRFARTRFKDMDGENICVVLSDGIPVEPELYSNANPGVMLNEYNLREEVSEAIKQGITFVSIGVQHKGVEQYYPPENTVVIDELKDLYPAMISKLKKLIKRG